MSYSNSIVALDLGTTKFCIAILDLEKPAEKIRLCEVPAEGMRMAIAELLNVGMKPEELISLARENPINLVGI